MINGYYWCALSKLHSDHDTNKNIRYMIVYQSKKKMGRPPPPPQKNNFKFTMEL